MPKDPWWEQMACRDVDPAVFERPRANGRNGPPHNWSRRALSICWNCPVRKQCLDEAVRMARQDLSGQLYPHVIGGVTPIQLSKLAGKRRYHKGV